MFVYSISIYARRLEVTTGNATAIVARFRVKCVISRKIRARSTSNSIDGKLAISVKLFAEEQNARYGTRHCYSVLIHGR